MFHNGCHCQPEAGDEGRLWLHTDIVTEGHDRAVWQSEWGSRAESIAQWQRGVPERHLKHRFDSTHKNVILQKVDSTAFKLDLHILTNELWRRIGKCTIWTKAGPSVTVTIIYLLLFLFFLPFSFLRQSFSVCPWLSWDSLCRPDWLELREIHLPLPWSEYWG